jgi:hypothetical protein
MHLHQVRQEADMTIQELKQRLARAEARLDEARSDGEWNAANEMVIYWRTLVDDAQARRAA